MKQPYVSTLIEQDFTSAEKALGRHNIDAISSADLEGYATQEWVQDQNYITSGDLPDVSDMATKTWTSENFYSATNPSGFITSADLPDMSEYATHEEVESATSGKMDSSEASAFYPRYENPEGYLTSADVSGFVDVNYVENNFYSASNPSGYITSADLPDLSDYVTKTYVEENFYSASNPSGFITSADLPDLSEYATIQYVDNSINSATSGKQDKLTFGYTDNKISSINSSAIYSTGGGSGSEIYRTPYGGSETFVSALKINSDDPDGYSYVTADDVGQGYLVSGPYKKLLDAGINSGYGVGDSATPIYIDNDGTFKTVSATFTQEQSDWTENDNTQVDYIKNKPTPVGLKAGRGITLTDETSAVLISSNVPYPTVECQAISLEYSGYVKVVYPQSSACCELHVTTPYRYDGASEYSAKIDDDMTWAIPSGAWYDFIKQDYEGNRVWCFKASGNYYG